MQGGEYQQNIEVVDFGEGGKEIEKEFKHGLK